MFLRSHVWLVATVLHELVVLEGCCRRQSRLQAARADSQTLKAAADSPRLQAATDSPRPELPQEQSQTAGWDYEFESSYLQDAELLSTSLL